MDRDDVCYFLSVLVVGVGAWLYHPGAGLVCGGVGFGFPFFLSIVRGVTTRPKDKS